MHSIEAREGPSAPTQCGIEPLLLKTMNSTGFRLLDGGEFFQKLS